jgi:hypothetical protein
VTAGGEYSVLSTQYFVLSGTSSAADNCVLGTERL